ncbi:hypothetical protein THRCLA_21740, partial [Thraustotheca clavata]
MLRNLTYTFAEFCYYKEENHCWSRSQVQKMIQDLVIIFATSLEKNNIEYWLDSGTLLGSIRSQGLIPHDVDADFGFTHEAMNKLRNTSMQFPKEYTLDLLYSPIYPDGGRDDALPGRFIDTRSGIYIDLFEFHPKVAFELVSTTLSINETSLINGTQYALFKDLNISAGNPVISNGVIEIKYNRAYDALSPPQSSCWGGCVMCPINQLFEVPVDWVYPLRRCIFENISMWCPAQSEKYLTMLYGPEYMTPHHVINHYAKENHCWSRKDVRLMVKELVVTFAQLMEQHNIEYWLDSGTLLGAIRQKGLIPHDDDADFGFTHAMFDVLRNTPMNFSSNYTLHVLYSPIYEDGGRDDALPGRFVDIRSGLYIDLFEFHTQPFTEEITVEIDIDSNTTEIMSGPLQLSLQAAKDAGVAIEGHLKLTYNSTSNILAPPRSSCWSMCAECKIPRTFQVPEEWIFPLQRCQFEGVHHVQCFTPSDTLLRSHEDKQSHCVHLHSHHLIMHFVNDSQCWNRTQIQTMLKDLVITFATTLEKHQIEYWLDSGTLLGAIRSQGVIPHDVDADFGLTRDAMNKLRNTPLVHSNYII